MVRKGEGGRRKEEGEEVISIGITIRLTDIVEVGVGGVDMEGYRVRGVEALTYIPTPRQNRTSPTPTPRPSALPPLVLMGVITSGGEGRPVFKEIGPGKGG